ncbi:hypothetical protein [Nostoc linckia]|nr:hypothetical protein [Nostoc linckia]
MPYKSILRKAARKIDIRPVYDAMINSPVPNQCYCQKRWKVLSKLVRKKQKTSNWKKYFQSCWTNDTIGGGIDEGVFAASKK